MDQRRSIPSGWVLLTLALVVVVGGLAYWVGATQDFHPFRRIGFGFGRFDFWLPLLILAVLVGLVVAALAPPARRDETFEERHRRAHGEGPTGPAGAVESTEADSSPNPGEDGPPPR